MTGTLIPSPPGPEAHYFDALNNGEFRIQRCGTCKTSIFYPRVMCPHCGSTNFQWFEPTGLGTIYSSTTVARKPDAGGDYNVALIDLDEGPRLMSRIEGVPSAAVRIGMRVRARVEVDGERAVLNFHSVEEEE